jgi:hypothetical protein
VLNTCADLNLVVIDPTRLPIIPEMTAVALWNCVRGAVLAENTSNRAARTEKLGAAASWRHV